MKFAVAKNRLISATAAMAVVAFALSPSVSADTFPYLKVFGGDTWAGGAFATSTGQCNVTSGYQDPANGTGPSGVANDRGGILTFANSGGGGSTDEVAAFALGSIDTTGTNAGFYSDQAHVAASKKLSFANTTSADGGLFEGSTAQGHCIPDYYDTKMNGTPGAFGGNYSATGQFQDNNGTLAGGTVGAGTKLTIFATGNVHITGNITYATGYTESTVPKFALVVKGNIFIDPAVTQLDGLYIAQPSSGTTDGRIWTCHDSSADASPHGDWMLANCKNKLLVNGALIAQELNFTRVSGDVGGAAANETAASNGAAEVINYTPAMVIGGPFFNPTPPASSLKIDSLVSLPPLF